DCIETWVNEQPRLVTVGRLGLFVPDNLHHVIEMGNTVARVINSDGHIDRQAWRLRREEFRSNVVED
ncbi:MAG TPA: FAD-dependent oxidoreductase, partial [Acidimicrobiaceae bacterium]|nr:FAD-dependent oxidoreductase [Acidimicrobiaceae bacterium]